MSRTPLPLVHDGVALAADAWPGPGPAVVLLHSGVTDRRGWHATGDLLAGIGTVVAYDRRGFGDTPAGTTPYRHVDDLLAVLTVLDAGPAWLVGRSMGGALALDTALAAPERVAGLVLIGTAVSGAPDPSELDAATQAMSDRLDAARAAGDPAELQRLEAWLWLDGPAEREGRVAGPARTLALAMNGRIAEHAVPEGEGDSGLDAWGRLEELRMPVTVAWGDLDVPFVVQQGRQLAARVPQARTAVLAGTAHLPYLEDPARVAALVRDAVQGAAPPTPG